MTEQTKITTRTDITSTSTATPMRWRDVLPIHPAASLFPLMSEAELRELAADIEKHGLRERIDLYDDPEIGTCVIDGRNRLDALELLGEVCNEYGIFRPRTSRPVGHNVPDFDPYAYVLSKNIHRRHLTPEQKRPLTVELVRASAELSNSLLAEIADVDDHDIADIRAELEATSEIPRFEKTIGRDGRARPARRAATKPKSAPKALAQSTPEPVSPSPAPKAAAPEAVTEAIKGMRITLSDVEAHAAASNMTMLKAALEAHLKSTEQCLKALGRSK